jgi:hypothetical protein
MPSHRAAEGVLILRVNLDGNTIKPPGNPTQRWTKEYLVNHVMLCLFYSFMTNPQAWQ